jgi:hypothetical protein
LEGRKANLCLRGLVQTQRAFSDFGSGFAFEAQGKALAQRTGVGGKTRKAFRARLCLADEAE